MKFTLTLMFLQTALFSFGATIAEINWRHYDRNTSSTEHYSEFYASSGDATSGYTTAYYVALNDNGFGTGNAFGTNSTHVQGSTSGFPSNVNLAPRVQGWNDYSLDFSTNGQVTFSMNSTSTYVGSLTNTAPVTTFTMWYHGVGSSFSDRYSSIGSLEIVLSDGRVLDYPFSNASEITGDEWSIPRQDARTFVRVDGGVLELGENNFAGDVFSSLRIDVSDIAPIPEPSSTALLGLGGLAILSRRKRN